MSLSPDELQKIDAYWRAANYLSVGQIYLRDNLLLEAPLTLNHVKPRLLGHWGTTPGLNFIYVHLNRLIKKNDLDMIYVVGPGHGGSGIVAMTYLEGSYTERYPAIERSRSGCTDCFVNFPGLRTGSTLILLVMADEDPVLPATQEAQRSYVRTRFEGRGWECDRMLAALDQREDFYFDGVSQIEMPTWSQGRIVLLGDAAFCPSLLAGEGTSLAMTAAYVLAGELHRAGADVGAGAASAAAYDAQAKSGAPVCAFVCAPQRFWPYGAKLGDQGDGDPRGG